MLPLKLVTAIHTKPAMMAVTAMITSRSVRVKARRESMFNS
jgi:hypothetical protein